MTLETMNATPATDLFLSVLDSHKGILYKVASTYCKNAEDRKDLLQEITIQLWRSFPNYSAQYQYSTWIYRIALNVAISFYRKENRRKLSALPLSPDIIEAGNSSPHPVKEEPLDLLQQFIAELRELDKALMLLYLEEKSYKEIAEIIGISETNVATKISRIKKLLQQKFATIKY
jgi:RNA polymerase sigma factor (sigma-70 family)